MLMENPEAVPAPETFNVWPLVSMAANIVPAAGAVASAVQRQIRRLCRWSSE